MSLTIDVSIIVCALKLYIKKYNNARSEKNETQMLLLLDGSLHHLNCIANIHVMR